MIRRGDVLKIRHLGFKSKHTYAWVKWTSYGGPPCCLVWQVGYDEIVTSLGDYEIIANIAKQEDFINYIKVLNKLKL